MSLRNQCTAARMRRAARLPVAALAAVLAAAGGANAFSQAPVVPAAAPAAPQSDTAAPAAQPPEKEKHEKRTSSGDRRKAAKHFLEASKQFEKEQFEAAMQGFQQAAALDPSNKDYALAAEVARAHLVTALIQEAARDRTRSDLSGTRNALAQALALDPKNPIVAQHLDELGEQATLGIETPRYSDAMATIGENIQIAPPAGVHSFHLKSSQRQVIQQVFKGFGLEATIDDTVRANQVRFDLEDATFEQAMRALSLLTQSFYVPLDPHRVLVAHDTTDLRQRFMPLELETIYLSGLSTAELTEVGNIARNVFEVSKVNADQSADKLTVQAPHQTLMALNETLRQLIDGRNQVLLEVRLIQLGHTSALNTGAQLPQSVTGFNVYAEEQQILNQNSSLVQQIISSGLASPGDTAAIIAILIASGQVSSSLFSNGILLFGNGLTLSGLQPQPLTVNISLNSSDTRELDQIQLRLGDGEAGTIRTGEKYPIMTSSYSNLGTGGINIPGLSSAGTSSALGGLAGLLGGSSSTTGIVPQVQYQDLGFTLKATPKVLRSGDIALTLDLKIDSLGGTSLNGVPILDNQAYQGVVTLPEGQSAVMLSSLSKQQSMAISGVPGLSEVPGLNDVTDKDSSVNYATLLVVITPHAVRGTRSAGHTPMMRIEPANRSRL